MISEGQFIAEFEKLEASFARSLTAKQRDGWYAEVQDVDWQRFRRTVAMLKMADHFPRFGDFWGAYRVTSDDADGADAKTRGCELCRDGYIHHIQKSDKLNREDEVVSFCSRCWPDHRNGADPRRAFRFVPNTEPFDRWTMPINREEALELCREYISAFNEVMAKKGMPE